uniref:MICOS complex subunit MIC60 n=1 Tax=Strigamia maritima TaxID=126957 RepID=T1IIE3_STRMM
MFRITRKFGKEATYNVTRVHSVSTRNATNIRYVHSATNSRGIRTRLLFGLTTATVASVGGVVAYAKYDPKFRSWFVDNVPFSENMFDLFLDPAKDSQIVAVKQPEKPQPPPSSASVERVRRQEALEPKREEPTSIKAPKELSKAVEVTEPLPIPEIIAEPAKSLAFQRLMQSEDAAFQQRLSMQETEAAAENAALAQILKEMTDGLTQVGQIAIGSHNAAVSSIKTYIEKLEEVLDAPKHAKDSAVKYVNMADNAKNEAIKQAQRKTTEAKELMEKIKTAIGRGRKSKLTVANPALLTSEEAVNNMAYKIQLIETQVESAKAEANVMSEYRTMVEKAQKEFQDELKKLLPEMKIGEGERPLTNEEVNHIINHAHKRVEHLQKQLALHQASEKYRFQAALDRKNEEHNVHLENVVNVEANKLKRELDLQFQHKLSEFREDFEQELRTQLRRQAAAHSDHLQDVLQTQQAELQAEFNKELEEKMGTARREFEANLSRSYARLHGIEEGIKARADLNKTARMSQNLWLACQSLRQAIRMGKPGARSWDEQLKPLADEMDAVKTAANIDGKHSRVEAILTAIPETVLSRGIYPETTLKERFLDVYRTCRRVAMVDEKGGSLWRFGLSYLQSMLLIDRPSPLTRLELAHTPIDPRKLNVFDILSRARWCIERDDLELALRYMNLLQGAPRIVATDWMNEVRMLLEVRQVADVLTALSAARGIQSIM